MNDAGGVRHRARLVPVKTATKRPAIARWQREDGPGIVLCSANPRFVMLSFQRLRYVLLIPVGMVALALLVPEVRAQQAREITITYRNKHFQPAEVSAPANTQLTIRIRNADAEAMEFESETLHVEKIVEGKSEATITLQPLKPGKYGFFDDYHAKSEGVLVIR